MSIGKSHQLFQGLSRQDFRRYFQPSRIVIAVLPDTPRQVNLITLCFTMYCSYQPPIMAFAIHKKAHSHSLLRKADHCVLSVPGESLARAALLCGTVSGKNTDKVVQAGLTLVPSETIPVPGIAESIANVELLLINKAVTGDHTTVFGKVLKFGVNRGNMERCLVSVGPSFEGYEVIASKGIHRIGVVKQNGCADLINQK